MQEKLFNLLYFLGLILQFVAIFTHYILWIIGSILLCIWVYLKFIKN